MIKLALIGAGAHARNGHAPAISYYAEHHPNSVERIAVCDIDLQKAEEFCREFGFARPYTDIHNMLENEVFDACVCTVPVALIADTVSLLFKKKICTLIEKPLGSSFEQSRDLLKIYETEKVPNLVSANRRFLPLLNTGIEWFRDQGNLRFIRGLFARPFRDEPDFFWSTAVHAIDTMRHIGSEIGKYAISPNVDDKGKNPWVQLQIQFSNAVTGTLDIIPTCGVNTENYEIYGSGFCTLFQNKDFFKEVSVQCWKNKKLLVDEKMDHRDPFFIRDGSLGEFSHFIDIVQHGKPSALSIDKFMPSTEICHEIVQSLKSIAH